MTASRQRSQGLEPTGSGAAARSEPQGSLVVVQERVLAEISHELGNFFHKLYYWSDYLKSEGDAGRSGRTSGAGLGEGDSTAGHMLERTISNLEEFLKVALEYFHPITLNFTKLPVSDLLDGFLSHIGAHLNGNEVRVFRDDVDRPADQPATILVDLPRISQAFQIALNKVREDLKSGGGLTVSFGRGTRRDFPGLEVRLTVEPDAAASPLTRGAEEGVEWAVAQKLIELHGGEIVDRVDSDGQKIVQIFLPLYV